MFAAWDVLYSVVSGGGGGDFFHLHPHSGQLTLTSSLDYETQNVVSGNQKYSFVIFSGVSIGDHIRKFSSVLYLNPIYEVIISVRYLYDLF